MLTVTFTVLGDRVLVRGLSRFGDAARDFMPVWPEILQDFQRIEAEQFSSEGARAGKVWPPLSVSYKEWKDKWFPGQPKLVLTGTLKMEMTEGLTVEAEPLRLAMYPALRAEVAGWHQKGTARMPARKVVDLTEADKLGWIRMIQRYLVDKATEAGLR